MKVFIKKIVVFLIPFLLVWMGIEYFYRTAASNYTYKHKMITENYEDIETLILGDSHALYGVNPEYMDAKAFNLANSSQSIYFDELLFKKHIDSLKNLKQLIISISYFNLSQRENTKGDTWRKYFYSNQMDLEVPIVSNFDIKEYSLALTKRFKGSVELINYYLDNGLSLVGCNSDGWGTRYSKIQDIDLCKNAVRRAKLHKDGLQDFTRNLNRIQSIIAYCKKINCKVYLIDLPVHTCYIKELDKNKLSKITASCKTLESNNSNVSYINLREDFRVEDSDFYDGDHLNHIGAKKYTKIINEIISASKNDY
ncbi:hypothetical protein [Aquimarina sp. 2201CG14-23]|uniref:hypothetical protein n=1 Tax=Aquimarina mycalae TaxID=3040073 RepID=UPI002477F3DD|nr:hypothetical protein [Aquimarina sp. 2201CG14-23]MDH7444974.1 hypothetical protein [Aquimarina sp. 2201CG14-23]